MSATEAKNPLDPLPDWPALAPAEAAVLDRFADRVESISFNVWSDGRSATTTIVLRPPANPAAVHEENQL